jgi:protein involved in polysaccharide export with SLBB domain
MHTLIALALALAAALAGCASAVSVPELAEADLPKLDAAANFPHRGYVIEAGDTLQIRYTFHQELNQEAMVQPDGKVNLHHVGDLEVAGRSPRDVEAMLVEKTSGRLRKPEIVVSVVKFSEKAVYVGGEVIRPGYLPYRRGLTPLQAVIAVGGFKETARPTTVVLVRMGSQPDQYISRSLNLSEAAHAGTREPLYLAPHDVVYVPRSPVADANLWVKQYIADMVPIFRGFSTPLPLIP